MSNTLGYRIRVAMKERGMSQAELARLIGTKQQTIGYLVSQERPATTSRYAAQIAQALGVNLAWLANGEGDRHSPTIKNVGGYSVSRVPVLPMDQIPAFVADQPFTPSGFVFTDRVKDGDGFAVMVSTDSMAPKILPGDCVIFDTKREPVPGDMAAALCKDGNVIGRRYRMRADGFELVPENPDWETVVSEHVDRIIGVMVEHRTYKLRHSVA